MSNTEVGAVIGRFQTPTLHAGHRALLDHVHQHHTRILIFIGVRPISRNERHPLSFEVRRKMLASEYPHAIILPIVDQPNNDLWSRKVDETVRAAVALSKVRFYCGRDGFKPLYSGSYPVNEIEFPDKHINATELRHKIESLDSDDFRAGIIYDIQDQASRLDNTVDIVAWRRTSNTTTSLKDVQILLGKKPHNTKFIMPGGFVDLNETFEISALRELREETGVSGELANLEFVGSGVVEDWRTADCPSHVIKTAVFTVEINWSLGSPRGLDDLSHAEWIPLLDLCVYASPPTTIPYLDADAPVESHHARFIEAACQKIHSILHRG